MQVNRIIRLALAFTLLPGGAPHGLTVTHSDKCNDDLLTFVKGMS